MAEQQQRIQGPYGDVVAVTTPTLDNWAKQLYAQQQQRQARQYQENQQLDQMMQKEFANIRSVDTPDVVNTYNQLKTAKKNLYFNKQLQKNPLLYNQAQQATNEIQARLNSIINKSVEIKDMTKTMTQDRFKNNDAYADDFGQRAATLMNTPISALQTHPQYGDLTNWDQYRYQGSNTDFNKKVKDAYGQNRNILGKEEALDKQGLQFRTPVYQYGNTPGQVFEGLVNSLDHKTERDAAFKWKQLTPDVINKIEDDYNAMPASKWQQMGLTGPQNIDLRAGGDAEKYMRVMAMQNAVNTNPTLTKYEKRESDKAKMDYRFAQDKVMEGIRFGHQKQLKKEEQKIVDNWVGNYWDTRITEAKAGPATAFQDPNNPINIKGAHQIQLDNVAAKALARNGVEPERLYVTLDNKILPIFYQYQEDYDDKGKKTGTSIKKDSNGNPLIDEDFSKPIGLDQAYLAMGYKGQTKKDLGGTMQQTYSNKQTEAFPLPAGKPRTVKQAGHTYIWNSQNGNYE